MTENIYHIELTKIDIETIMQALEYLTDGVRATLIKLKVSSEDFSKTMNELYANELYRKFLAVYKLIERGQI